MKIYTLFYDDTKMYNRSIFVIPNDETAKKAMKLNLMEQNAERFRNEVKDGHVNLVALGTFDEEKGMVSYATSKLVCNLKELLDDDKGNSTEVQHNDAN